ncbi:hypothetical protein R6Q59_022522 [Mikania micrantha]
MELQSFHKSIVLLMAFFITFISSSHAYTFQVGGKLGWTLHPSEPYISWSSRLRFLINDTLHFKYDDGSDSVLVVDKQSEYDGCHANNPITKVDGGGDSMFKFDRSGPFYFITGNKSNCDHGQKLMVVVLALRNRSPPPSVATPPSPSTRPPSPTVSPLLPPSKSHVSPARSPSISPVSPPSNDGSPESPPTGAPALTPPVSSPDGQSADSPMADSPGEEMADSPEGDSADSPAMGRAYPPRGGGRQSPGSNSPRPNVIAPPPSAAKPPPCATVTASLLTMMLALWGLN